MKKLILPISLILLLAACAGRPNPWQETDSATPIPSLIVTDEDVGSTVPNETDAYSQTSFDASNPGGLPVQAQIINGIFLLENTDLGISPEQAAALLPDWKTFAEINSASDVTQDQLGPIIQQIQAIMTPEQIAAIDEMQLGFQDLMGLINDLGISVPRDDFGQGGNHIQIPPQLVDAFIEHLHAKNQ